MFMIEYKDIGWWYWLITAGLLTYGVTGNTIGYVLTISLTIFQIIHFILREKSIAASSVQVRYWYLILLIVALPEPMQFVYWIPAIGTWAQVIFGYCAMARIVSLLPWNKSEPFSFALLQKTFFLHPLRGNIQQGLAAVD